MRMGLVVGMVLTMGVGFLGSQASAQLSPQELLAGLDNNTGYGTSYSVGTITIKDRRGTRVSAFESWSQGTEQSLIHFTSGNERGQKILRLPDALYMAFPETDKPIKIQGAALRDSVAGSDFSYEDMAGSRSLRSRFDASFLKNEVIQGRNCAVLELKAKTRGEAYPILRIWVALDDTTGLKIEKYSQNARLLKTQEVTGFLRVGSRLIPSTIVMIDHMKGQSSTTFSLSRMDVDIPIPPSTFSLEELTW